MICDYRCFFCFTRAVEKLLQKEPVSQEEKGLIVDKMITAYQNSRNNFSAPEFSREINLIIQKYSGNNDLYKEEKRETNNLAISMLPELTLITEKSDDRFNTALRIAIAGNIMDFAANDNFNLQETVQKTLKEDFAIDHSVQLKEALKNAGSVLYLGDNAGEIVFDKLFIKTTGLQNVTFVVRGGAVLNDVTAEDAEYTGMKEIANVISNGYDAPSTLPDKSSEEFCDYYNKADVIISKGQGNLEGLYHLKDKRIFFLLLVKCDVIAESLKVPKNSIVVYNSSYYETNMSNNSQQEIIV